MHSQLQQPYTDQEEELNAPENARKNLAMPHISILLGYKDEGFCENDHFLMLFIKNPMNISRDHLD